MCWGDSDRHLCQMPSSRSSYLNCISIDLNCYLNLLSKSNSEIDLSTWLKCIVLFSKPHGKDCIEWKDSDEAHGTPRVPKEELRLASVGRRRVSWVVWDWISYSDPTYLYRFWPVASAFLPLPIQLPFYICITTLDGTITHFSPAICLLSLCILTSLLLILTYLAFLPIATYCYLILIMYFTYLLIRRVHLVIALTISQCPPLFKCLVGNP